MQGITIFLIDRRYRATIRPRDILFSRFVKENFFFSPSSLFFFLSFSRRVFRFGLKRGREYDRGGVLPILFANSMRRVNFRNGGSQ